MGGRMGCRSEPGLDCRESGLDCCESGRTCGTLCIDLFFVALPDNSSIRSSASRDIRMSSLDPFKPDPPRCSISRASEMLLSVSESRDDDKLESGLCGGSSSMLELSFGLIGALCTRSLLGEADVRSSSSPIPSCEDTTTGTVDGLLECTQKTHLSFRKYYKNVI